LPAGIADFAPAKAKVFSGRRPMLDGLDWLKQNGFRTVLFVHLPGEEDLTGRRELEKRELKYFTLEVSPKNLTTEVVASFNRLVDEEANWPLFVYSPDRSLLGGLWYLHFRIAENLSDEEAQRKATPLGLKKEGDGSQTELWLAIQKYLEKTKSW
jgi:protein tyrosine phosphatase (PTP) superfamily phosphohydrolase (DUF442 family)